MTLIWVHPFTSLEQQKDILEAYRQTQTSSAKFSEIIWQKLSIIMTLTDEFSSISDKDWYDEKAIAKRMRELYINKFPDFLSIVSNIYPWYVFIWADLHRHSIASNDTSWNFLNNVPQIFVPWIKQNSPTLLWLLDKPESYLRPEEVLMNSLENPSPIKIWDIDILTYATITDHNTIEWAMKLRKIANKSWLVDRSFLSNEYTVRIPNIKIWNKEIPWSNIHIPTFAIPNRKLAKQLNNARINIFEFLNFVKQAKIWKSMWHMFFNVENLQTEHVFLLFLLFDSFEINIERSAFDNLIIMQLLHKLDQKMIEDLIQIYWSHLQWYPNLLNWVSHLKKMTAWTDDHSWLYQANWRNATIIVAKDTSEQSIRNALNWTDWIYFPNLIEWINAWFQSVFCNSLYVTLDHVRENWALLPPWILKVMTDISTRKWNKSKLTEQEVTFRFQQNLRKQLLDIMGIRWILKSWWKMDIIVRKIATLLYKLHTFKNWWFEKLVENFLNKELQKQPEFAHIYHNTVQLKNKFLKSEIDRNEYNSGIYKCLWELINQTAKEFIWNINKWDIEQMMDLYYFLLLVSEFFVNFSIGAMYSTRHIHSWLHEIWIIDIPEKPQKTLLYVSDLDGLHGVAKSVIDILKSNQRHTKIHLITVIKNKKAFLEKQYSEWINMEQALDNRLWKRNYDIFEAVWIIRPWEEDFPLMVAPIYDLIQRTTEINPTSVIDFTQDLCWLEIERCCDGMNLPIITVNDTDIWKFIEQRFGIPLSSKIANYLIESVFHNGKYKSLCAPSKDYLETNFANQIKWRYLLPRFYDANVFRIMKKEAWYLESQSINRHIRLFKWKGNHAHLTKVFRIDSQENQFTNYCQEFEWKGEILQLENPFEKYSNKNSVNVTYFWRIAQEKNIVETIKNMMKYFHLKYKKTPAWADWTFDDIAWFFDRIPIFHIIWDWPHFTWLIKFCIKRKIPVVVYWRIDDRDKLAKLINHCDFKFFPSKTDTFGRVAVEAMACWLPVLTYDEWWPKDIVWYDPITKQQSWAWIVANNNEQFFQWFLEMSQNIEVLKKMSELSLERVSIEFSEQKIIWIFDNMIKDIEKSHKQYLLNLTKTGSQIMSVLDLEEMGEEKETDED